MHMDRHQHDPDLIASHAEGLLDDPGEAERLVATCPRCRDEYNAQQQVRSVLSGMPAVSMSAEERARLRAAIHDLRPQPRSSWSPWYLRVASAAAALVVLAGLAGVLNNQGGGATTTTRELAAAGDTALTTTAAAAETTDGNFTFDSADLKRLDGGDAGRVKLEVAAMEAAVNEREMGTEVVGDHDDLPCWEFLGTTAVLDGARSELDGEPIVIYIVATDGGTEPRVFEIPQCNPVDLGP
jgi:hypothetical protein